MRRHSESVMRIGRKIGLNDDNGVAIGVFIALIIITVVVVSYYFIFPPAPEPYNSMALLDTQMQAKDYPEVLVVNQNSTFSVYVNVTNHMNQDLNYRVETKIIENLPANFPEGLPINPTYAYEFALANGESNQELITISQNEIGRYHVVFELWQQDLSGYKFTGNYCQLNLNVIL